MTQLRIQVLQAWKRCLKVTGNVFKNDPPALTIGKILISRFIVVLRGRTATRCVLERILVDGSWNFSVGATLKQLFSCRPLVIRSSKCNSV